MPTEFNYCVFWEDEDEPEVGRGCRRCRLHPSLPHISGQGRRRWQREAAGAGATCCKRACMAPCRAALWMRGGAAGGGPPRPRRRTRTRPRLPRKPAAHAPRSPIAAPPPPPDPEDAVARGSPEASAGRVGEASRGRGRLAARVAAPPRVGEPWRRGNRGSPAAPPASRPPVRGAASTAAAPAPRGLAPQGGPDSGFDWAVWDSLDPDTVLPYIMQRRQTRSRRRCRRRTPPPRARGAGRREGRCAQGASAQQARRGRRRGQAQGSSGQGQGQAKGAGQRSQPQPGRATPRNQRRLLRAALARPGQLHLSMRPLTRSPTPTPTHPYTHPRRVAPMRAAPGVQGCSGGRRTGEAPEAARRRWRPRRRARCCPRRAPQRRRACWATRRRCLRLRRCLPRPRRGSRPPSRDSPAPRVPAPKAGGSQLRQPEQQQQATDAVAGTSSRHKRSGGQGTRCDCTCRRGRQRTGQAGAAVAWAQRQERAQRRVAAGRRAFAGSAGACRALPVGCAGVTSLACRHCRPACTAVCSCCRGQHACAAPC